MNISKKASKQKRWTSSSDEETSTM